MDENRLVELEIKAAYQEDLLQALDNIVANQQQAIANLEKMCRILAERIDSLNALHSKPGGQEIPPHY